MLMDAIDGSTAVGLGLGKLVSVPGADGVGRVDVRVEGIALVDVGGRGAYVLILLCGGWGREGKTMRVRQNFTRCDP